MQLKIGKDLSFYKLLQSQAEVALRSAREFDALVKDFSQRETHRIKLEDLEHEGDDLTHELQNKVTVTFITPIDKEDLRSLSQTLDDITDAIEAVASRVSLYRLEAPRPELPDLADSLVRATEVVHRAVAELQNGFHRSSSLRDMLTEIHTIENESDKIFRTALGHLFDEPNADPLSVMKWKEVFDRIEAAVDKCEDIAAIIGTVMVKYA